MERKPQTLAGNQPFTSLCTCSWGWNTHLWVLSAPYSPAPCVPTRRFLSGLTLPSPHCAFCTVIQSCVLGSQTVHLQIQHVLGGISRVTPCSAPVLRHTGHTYFPEPTPGQSVNTWQNPLPLWKHGDFVLFYYLPNNTSSEFMRSIFIGR